MREQRVMLVHWASALMLGGVSGIAFGVQAGAPSGSEEETGVGVGATALARSATAAELARALAAAGVELPDGFVVNGDGTVTVPSAVAGAMAPTDDGESGVAVSGVAVSEVAGSGVAVSGVAVSAGTAEAVGVSPGSVLEDDAEKREPAEGGGGGGGAVDEGPKAAWDSTLALSVSFTDGDSSTSAFRLEYTGQRKAEKSLLKLSGSYAYTESDGVAEVNRARLSVNHDWKESDARWFGFAGGRGDYDQFRSFRYRANVNGGLGFRAMKNDRFKLTLRGGAGATREFGSDNDDVVPEGLVGADFGWQVTENQAIESTLRYYPDFGDFNMYRVVGTAEWRFDLEEINDGLGLVAGLEYEKITEVDAGSSEDDVYVYAGVTWDF